MVKTYLISLIFILGSCAIAQAEGSVTDSEPKSFCGLVRSVFYERSNFKVLTAQVTVTSKREAVRVKDAQLSERVLLTLGEQEEAFQYENYIAQMTSVMRNLFIQICINNLTVYEETENGYLIRSGYFDSPADVEIITF